MYHEHLRLLSHITERWTWLVDNSLIYRATSLDKVSPLHQLTFVGAARLHTTRYHIDDLRLQYFELGLCLRFVQILNIALLSWRRRHTSVCMASDTIRGDLHLRWPLVDCFEWSESWRYVAISDLFHLLNYGPLLIKTVLFDGLLIAYVDKLIHKLYSWALFFYYRSIIHTSLSEYSETFILQLFSTVILRFFLYNWDRDDVTGRLELLLVLALLLTDFHHGLVSFGLWQNLLGLWNGLGLWRCLELDRFPSNLSLPIATYSCFFEPPIWLVCGVFRYCVRCELHLLNAKHNIWFLFTSIWWSFLRRILLIHILWIWGQDAEAIETEILCRFGNIFTATWIFWSKMRLLLSLGRLHMYNRLDNFWGPWRCRHL